MTAPTAQTEKDPIVRFVDWINKNRRTAIVVVATLILGVAAIMYWNAARERRESFANSLLETARNAAAAGNTALAANDLASLSTTHRGTAAAEEAAILLAQIRLADGQPQTAQAEMQRYIAQGPSAQFRAPAYGLLGNAFEQAQSLDSAAVAYRNAAQAAWYDFLEAQYLIDAARVLIQAGDTIEAAALYDRIITDLSETDMVMEARLRLGEIRGGGIDDR